MEATADGGGEGPPQSSIPPVAEDVQAPEIPVDATYENDEGDSDSAFGGSSDDSDLQSLDSSITKYRFENGRRYHAFRDGAYWAPNDEAHNDQQDIAHHLWLLTLDNQLHLAPLVNPQNILDVGTGTGIWAIDIADRFPSASVIGVDLSPIQPIWVAPNCSFEIDDMNMEWTYPPSSFDYIHIREMFGSVDNWDTLYAEAYKALRPGGYLENAEHSIQPVSDDDTVGPDHIFTQYGTIMTELSARRGKEVDVWKRVKEYMERAGFEDVKETRLKWPMRAWSSDAKMKELGRWNQLRIERGIEGFAMRMLTAVGGWSYLEVQAFVGKIRSALRDRSLHAYLDVTVVYGRKPMNAS